MQTQLGHIEVKVAPGNLAFYRELMAFLGWSTIFENEEILGVGGSSGASLWFVGHASSATNDATARA
ncbi:MAG: hypothetical protein ACR2HN_08735 [Tepidiformaceae bacterium]